MTGRRWTVISVTVIWRWGNWVVEGGVVAYIPFDSDIFLGAGFPRKVFWRRWIKSKSIEREFLKAPPCITIIERESNHLQNVDRDLDSLLNLFQFVTCSYICLKNIEVQCCSATETLQTSYFLFPLLLCRIGGNMAGLLCHAEKVVFWFLIQSLGSCEH